MSIDSARVVCTGCDYETRDLIRPVRIRYQAADGKSVVTGCATGWCYDCADYSSIERINPDVLRKELAQKEQAQREARDQLAALSEGWFSRVRHRAQKGHLRYQLGNLNNAIAELGALIRMVNHRSSKARCLKCWSNKTAPVTFDAGNGTAQDFVHECGGQLRIIHDHSGPRFHFRVATYVLNQEGELLAEE
jgi:hypothetical protein